MFNSQYKKDYDLGDIVTIVHKDWGLTVSQRIVEITESYENDNISFVPVFGSPLPEISDLLKLKNK